MWFSRGRGGLQVRVLQRGLRHIAAGRHVSAHRGLLGRERIQFVLGQGRRGGVVRVGGHGRTFLGLGVLVAQRGDGEVVQDGVVAGGEELVGPLGGWRGEGDEHRRRFP